MRFINPSPGELMDRLTILRLKIAAGEWRQADVGHFREESELIEAALGEWWRKHPDADRRAYQEAERGLAEVNRKLWEAEDEVRQLPSSARDRLAELAKLIPELNDHRAALVQRVNALFHIRHPEKLYRHDEPGGAGEGRRDDG